MSITAKELAQKLGLSTAAVSMALNNKPGVSEETRRRVKDMAMKCGYDFSQIMKKRNYNRTIAFIIYKKYGAIITDNPFFSQVTEGISLRCRDIDYKLHINYCYEDEHAVQRQLRALTPENYCGVILLGTEMTAEDIKPFLTASIPVILLDAYYDSLICDAVIINNSQGAYLATQHLIRRCRCQPGYLASSYAVSNLHARANGFYQAIRDAGMSASKSIKHLLTPSIEGAFTDMLAVLDRGDDLAGCYFADNDLIAAGAIQALHARGYRVPEDISVVGFDNIPIAQMPNTALTTVSVPKHDLGALCVDRLIERIKNPFTATVKVEVRTELVYRQTVRNSE